MPAQAKTNLSNPGREGGLVGNHNSCLPLTSPSFFTVDQAAEILGLSGWTLRGWRWRFTKRLPLPPAVRAFVVTWCSFGRAIRVPAESLRAFIEGTRIE